MVSACTLTWEHLAAGASSASIIRLARDSALLLLSVKLTCVFLLEVTDCHPSTPLSEVFLPLLLAPLRLHVSLGLTNDLPQVVSFLILLVAPSRTSSLQ